MITAEAMLDQLLADPDAVDLATPLPDDVAAVVVERLKQEADRHWAINAHRSLAFADLISRIAAARGDIAQLALGRMARGDALKLLGRNLEAWEALDEAGAMFRAAGDDVGWARTRIGRLGICVDLNRVDEALQDAEAARAIFSRHHELDKLLRLDYNTAYVNWHLGDPHRALPLIRAALQTAERLGEAGEQYGSWLFTLLGLTYDSLGDFRAARVAYQQARAVSEARGEWSAVARVEHNLAYLAIAQGRYREALQGLHRSYDLVAGEFPHLAAHARRDMVECYLALNRFAEARDLARQVRAEWRALDAQYEEAVTLTLLATAEAELGEDESARAALDAAEQLFESLGATAWSMVVRLRRGRIALRQGDQATARRAATDTAAWFAAAGQQVNQAAATLLRGQVAFAEGDHREAVARATEALRIARASNVPAIRYGAHLLLGQAADARADSRHAVRRYRAAAATVERVQRGLSITLRPGFLEDKADALHALIDLELRTERVECAFAALERAKSQALLGYLANREQLRWASNDPESRRLIERLDRLRAEHQWFFRLAHGLRADAGDHPTSITPAQALFEVAARERQMRAITERLYLLAGDGVAGPVQPVSLAAIRRALDGDTGLIEFYNNGRDIWAFALDRDVIRAQRLTTSVAAVAHLVSQVQINIAAALKAGPAAPVAAGLTMLAQRLLHRLHESLLAPFESWRRDRRRLVIVPYGVLHYLPFHLLHSGAAYLIEQHELVVLPTAALAVRRGPVRRPGARVLAHSWDGRLPQTLAEAAIVARLWDGTLLAEAEARRGALESPPTQILHIAAHGEYRLDQPDLSYIQLADGQLYTDDLLQQDMSYELVTLSACETGRARVAAGDELIGLGRGFLYAGAGALLVSLWRVADDSTVRLMRHFYGALHAGASKAAALRSAQRAMIATQPQLHPAFWGAFQLVGDAGPLSQAAPAKEYDDATA